MAVSSLRTKHVDWTLKSFKVKNYRNKKREGLKTEFKKLRWFKAIYWQNKAALAI